MLNIGAYKHLHNDSSTKLRCPYTQDTKLRAHILTPNAMRKEMATENTKKEKSYCTLKHNSNHQKEPAP